MIHEKITELGRVWRRGTRRRSVPQNRRRLLLEALEDRRMLATNITVTDAFLRDGLGLRNNTPVLGEQVEIQVNFQTTDLFAAAAYRIEFSIDGVTLDSGTIRSGAGLPSGAFFERISGWHAEPGEHTVDVVLDAGGNVTETNEQDNAFSFTFTPVRATLPST
ncbi:MAG: CARDB domain-containing protein [Pirellulaceae bacterium]|nr:CARDB domain-containing protein [Pirellulaceae bacterium]